MRIRSLLISLLAGAAAVLVPLAANAAAPAANPAPVLNTGDTAWMLVSSALVLLMTPGLALFYGGMVRSKNVLSSMMHSFVVMGIVAIQYVLIGYSLSFTAGNSFIGDLSKAMLSGLTPDTLFQYVATSANAIPEYVFVMFQMMFASSQSALSPAR